MRDVLIIAKCDKCHTDLEVGDEPLPRWTINGTTYRPELCGMCESEVLAALDFLTLARTRKAEPAPKKARKGGKFAKVETPCPACERVFSTPSGLSQHMSQLVKKGDRVHKKYIREGGEV